MGAGVTTIPLVPVAGIVHWGGTYVRVVVAGGRGSGSGSSASSRSASSSSSSSSSSGNAGTETRQAPGI